MQIINKLVEINGLNIGGRLFNLFEPDEGLRLSKDNSAIFTVATMEQLGRNYEPFLTRLKELEKEGRLEILKAQRIFFGSLYHDGYFLVVWRST